MIANRQLASAALKALHSHGAHDVPRVAGSELKRLVWGSGPALTVLLHGVGDCALVWDPVVRSMRPRGTVVALDLPGHGNSDPWPADRMSVESIAEGVSHAIEPFGASSLVFVGHSLGAQVAIHLADRYRERTAALMLVDGGPYTRQAANAAIYEKLRQTPDRHESLDDYLAVLRARFPLAEERVLAQFADGTSKRNADGLFELKCGAELATSVQYSSDEQLVERLQRLACPTLVVRGAWSSVLPVQEAQRMLDHLDIGGLVEVPEAGHCVPLENPAGLGAVLEQYLDQVLDLVATT
jgi:pimeloyl-ACP methyl ester carboxylesterase